MKKIDKLYIWALIVGTLLFSRYCKAQIIVGPITNPHPRLLMNNAELQTMNARIVGRQQPWYSCMVSFSNRVSIAYAGSPSPYTGNDIQVFYPRTKIDSERARDLALMYYLGGPDTYAQKAISYLNAWATANPTPALNFAITSENGLLVARFTLGMIWTYDLLYNHPAMTPQIKNNFESWLRILESVIKDCIQNWEDNDYYTKQYYQNHVVAHTMGLLAIGYAIGDVNLAQFAIDHPDNPRDLVELIREAIFMPEDTPCIRDYSPDIWPVQKGEIYDRYRHKTGPEKGLQYSHLTTRLLTFSAEMAFHNGLDFYSYTAPTGENLELPMTFLADFHRLKDASIKGGYYFSNGHDESWRIGIAGDPTNFFELAFKRYPHNVEIAELLGSINRVSISLAQLDESLGDMVLIYGQPLCWEGRVSADINHDCKVNFQDLTYLVQSWLNCSVPFADSCQEGDVKISD
ncbi:MAG: hypothetical protein A2Y10_19955 [Planctomycetes bacterium GWF2_41_51]|nr:MAG: hypothetical protein A2Y10_19955 [Planctomycetes bacterium GWF2_41_51]HBG28560.1 hypothetical protein [Phycisphaerales bacterium]